MDQQEGMARKAQYRRALGELTNTPLLLSPGGGQVLSHSPLRPSPLRPLGEDPGRLATPPKALPSSPADSITPTHNLKMLTELASKMPGALSSARQTLQFEEPEPVGRARILLLPGQGPSPHKDHSYLPRAPGPLTASQFREQLAPRPAPARGLSPGPAQGSAGGNRKDKSLGILAERMLASLPYAMGAGESTELQLDDTARVLCTERRRIYDIVNVFEAVQIMSKVGKNVYQWHGRTYLVQSLAWLRQLATRLGVHEQHNAVKEQEMQQMIHNQENVNIENVSPGWANSPTFSPVASSQYSPMNSPYNSPNDPNGTSMGINTQKFLMLFLVSPQPQTLTLDFAAKVIHGIHQVEKTRLTRVRRLYDIANILQSLGLIRKVSLTDGRGKKPAYQYIGPDVSGVEVSDEEKRGMPSARQKNSLLAVGRSLALLPEAEGGDLAPAGGKRARSLSEEREREAGPTKLTRTRSESVIPRPDLAAGGLLERQASSPLLERQASSPLLERRASSPLLDLGTVCGAERARLEEPLATSPSPVMKPPTPGRPPSRKKHLLQRYYSDSALLSSAGPPAHTFASPRPVVGSPCSPTTPRTLAAAPAPPAAGPARALALHAVPQSPRANYSPLHPSPLTKPAAAQPPVSPRVRAPMRSPITPRDLRNSSILPPHSPTRTKLITCSPMGPVGRSLLSSPASPRAPMDLRVARAPLAPRALALPPSPCPAGGEAKSPLLRAYLASSKAKSLFQPLGSPGGLTLEEGVSLLQPDLNDSVSNGSTALSLLSGSPSAGAASADGRDNTSPDGSASSASSSASELEGIFGRLVAPPRAPPARPPPRQLEAPLDFSGLLSAPGHRY